ncbi:hypothetical protein CYY_009492 [Polysphondylium violaceum]|uniref:Uncharacterized protein n=1 Tax=Polysphondylium violaceum TaxID=133409 RepID=A0A8J4PK42_9MYCE|nr:hypothetical protein CYY_009492 [Polysphondylium violaceum]
MQTRSSQEKTSGSIKQFSKSLIFVFLSKANLKNVIDKLLELSWTPESQKYLTKYLLDVHKGKYGNIYLIFICLPNGEYGNRDPV